MSKKLRGTVSTRWGILVGGMKTKYSVDPGLQDTIVPIANAQISALSERNTSTIYVSHTNTEPQMLPPYLRYLEENPNNFARPMGLMRRVIPLEEGA